MKKKILTVLISFMLTATLLTGCGSSKKANTTTGNASTENVTTENTNTEKSSMKIAIVTSGSGVDDGSFNQNCYDGVLKFIDNHAGASVNAIVDPTGDPAASIKAVSDIVADYDVIVCCGYQFAGIGTLAEENTDTKFVVVDTYPVNADGETVICDNVYGMTFAEQEGGFFAGVAAALESQSKKVAVVNGVAYPSNVNYQYGFESGVNYANKKYATKVELVELASYAGTDVTGKNVGGNYVGSFTDEASGKVVGNALINEGCDIVFVAAGASGNGVFTAAKEAQGIKVIGCDVNQYKDGQNGDSNIILTSALKNMDVNVERQLNAIADGSFKGDNAVLGASTDSTGYVKESGQQQLLDNSLSKLEEAYGLVKNGTIVPAANFNNIEPDDFPGLN